MQKDSTFELIEGVYVSKSTLEKFSDFEKNYLALRHSENRVLSLEQIRRLPDCTEDNADRALWQIRKKSITRFLNYLRAKKHPQRILDIGCGNGFFTNLLSASDEVVGIDVNLTELKQAALAFPDAGIRWYYADILNELLPESKFDLIIFCASFQYFENAGDILTKCLSLLNAGGEIHIIDSPFYTQEQKQIAQQNTKKHFSQFKLENMTSYYHHNTWDVLQNYSHYYLYKPNRFLAKWLRRKDSPFPWIKIIA